MQINASTVALVTGGASGLGEATVRRLHEGGAAVVIVDLPGSPGAALAEELGEHAVFAPADVRDEAQVLDAIAAAKELGDLRIVVTCAGVGTPGRIVGKRGPLELEALRSVVEINLVGTFNVLRLAAARDLADKHLRVVTIAPGTFETPMLSGLPGDVKSVLEAQVPHPSRLGRPSEYASLVAHVVDNPMLNGEVIRLDGALRMPPR